jgi:predicted O-methyltransferase YrrM
VDEVRSSAEAIPRCSLRDERIRRVLERLHGDARRDPLQFVKIAPRLLLGLARGKSFSDTVQPSMLARAYLAVPPEEGEFLYLTARAIGARRIVEFGTSFGISTIYLAAALRDNGGGIVVGSELEANKRERALVNLQAAGLAEHADVRLGDAMETLAKLEGPLDLLFLDGWKDLYLPVLHLLEPRLRPGSVVLADNIRTFRQALRPYVEYVQTGGGYASTTLSISDGLEYSVKE